MFGISGFELLIIAVFVLIIFGPDKLPELARTFGRVTKMFRSAQQDMERIIRAEMIMADNPNAPGAAEIAGAGVDSEEPAEDAKPMSAASIDATAAWAATAEDDDDEEEDEE